MTSPNNHPEGHQTIVYGRAWYFSARVLTALAATGATTEATLSFCAMNLKEQVEEFWRYLEVTYFYVGLRGCLTDRVILIDALPVVRS